MQTTTENIITKDEQSEAPPNKKRSFFEVFRFADPVDYLMMIFGSLGSLGTGAVVPIFVFLLALFNDSYQEYDKSQVQGKAVQNLLRFIYLSIGAFACGWMMITLWMITGERQITKCRKAYLQALLLQDIGYFDCINQSELNAKFAMDTNAYQETIGEKIGLILQIIGSFLCTLIISFTQGWLLTLICLASLPLIILSAYFNIAANQSKDKEVLSIYMQAGGRAQQALAAIKTVKQLNGEQHEFGRYQQALQNSEKNKFKFSFKIGLSNACIQAATFLVYALGFWQGSNCVEGNSHCPTSVTGGNYTLQNVEAVFFTIVGSCFTLSQLTPALKKIAEGRAAFERIFDVLDRSPAVKNGPNPIVPEKFEGKIEFVNVKFAFPKSKGKIVLNRLSISFDLSSTALVGDSGCGKSTILQLLLRFYDPDQGRILLDGNDLRTLDLQWLRAQIGYVGQEPVLFAASIRDNLLMSCPNATQAQIDDALRQAEAYDFVYNILEDKLETFVGVGGGQISGGQKQRIAIARALLKKPKILLLDEATSALDRSNQKLIQKTFDKISEGLTTITVAHRVPTIMNANLICVIKDGRVQQSGRFQQLRRYIGYETREKNSEMEPTDQRQAIILKEASPNQTEARLNIEQLAEPQSNQNPPTEQPPKQQQEQLVRKYKKGMFLRIFSYNRRQIPAFIITLIVSIISGLIYPVFSIFLSRMILSLDDLQHPQRHGNGRRDADLSSLVFLFIAIASFLLYFFQSMLGELVGDQITNNLRAETFHKFLKMPISWFDRKQNSSGQLGMHLSTGCQVINGMTTTYVFILLQCLSSLLGGIIIAFVFEWRITLVALGMVPFLIIAAAVRTSFRTGLSQKIDLVHRESGGMINESLTHIRTVVSLGVEPTLISRYSQKLQGPYLQVIKTGVIAGMMNGLSIVFTYIIFGILLYIGAIFMVNQNVSLLELITAIFECFFISISIGNNVHFLPDTNIAAKAAAKIFQVLDAEDQQQLQIRQQSQMLRHGFEGTIKFEGVEFRYDNRKTPVFENLNLEIERGQRLAFVGPSGCGKSTILQLLLRFYEPSKGLISVGGIDIKNFDLPFLRRQFGVVSQEPVLFNGSFADNIRYDDATATITDLRTAASQANALTFIQGDEKLEQGKQMEKNQGIEGQNKEEGNQKIEGLSSKEGFRRVVGLKGFHISGGQKQRVAIARAILRNPKILLLDEATSALDAQNQKIVQASLDRIMQGRTTVTVAHRLETLKNSDVICVVERGVVVESGSYETLLSRKGFFYDVARGHQSV